MGKHASKQRGEVIIGLLVMAAVSALVVMDVSSSSGYIGW